MNLAKLAMASAIALGLLGCQSQSTLDASRITAAYAFTFYASAYQPALAQYARLPTCSATVKAPCKDAALYKKLYELDGAVANCAVAAQLSISSETPDFPMINACIQQVEIAKLEFASKAMKGAQ